MWLKISRAWRRKHPDIGGTEDPKQNEPKRPAPRDITKTEKLTDKEIIAKVAKEKQKVTHKGTP